MSRYGIPSDNAVGISMGDIKRQAKRIGRDHGLALALWESGNYEARSMAAFLDEPHLVTPDQMDGWCADFDSWAICDTICFHLFDKTPHALAKVEQWAVREEEFQKRAAFALLASVALHVKTAEDEDFRRCLPLLQAGAKDGRNFVKKSVSWAMRSIAGKRPALRAEITELAEQLAGSDDAAERWVGKDVVRQLVSRAPR